MNGMEAQEEGEDRGHGDRSVLFSDTVDTLGLAVDLHLRVRTKPEALNIVPSSLTLAARPI